VKLTGKVAQTENRDTSAPRGKRSRGTASRLFVEPIAYRISYGPFRLTVIGMQGMILYNLLLRAVIYSHIRGTRWYYTAGGRAGDDQLITIRAADRRRAEHCQGTKT
jgi:hypothetical protein